MNKKDKNIVVREKLMTQKDVVFTCGIKDVLGRIQEYKVYASDRSDVMSFAIIENTSFGKAMNVNKFGPTCVTLYTYDMLFLGDYIEKDPIVVLKSVLAQGFDVVLIDSMAEVCTNIGYVKSRK